MGGSGRPFFLRECRDSAFPVVRMVDARRNALIYLTYSDRVIEGSPENSVTAFAVQGARIPLER